MTIEQQCCTLAQSKRLKELGINQSLSLFAVYEGAKMSKATGKNIISDVWGYRIGCEQSAKEWKEEEKVFAAFTVAELGVMLPEMCSSHWYRNEIIDDVIWVCAGALEDPIVSGNEAQSRAALLIHLLETGKVTAEECNNRLTQ